MNKKHLYIILAVICLLAFFNTILASNHPDGLERVAEDHGFINRAHDSFSILADYALPFKNKLISGGTAGLLGVIVSYLLLVGIGKLVSKN